EIYFKDPFLAYAYVGSIPFFMVLHRLFEILGQLRRNGTLPPEASHGFRSIKRCALTCIGFVAGGIVFILLLGDPDDRPAGLFMSLLVAVPGMVVASAAAMFERKLRNAST
ncbi:MAG TPA: DUF2975 domain-containing protein, partial [Lacunisphaera sp.]|nr:DUF2975 domain-containing protein [Lacunisphaera sp.]